MRRGYMGVLCGVMVVCGVAAMGYLWLDRPGSQRVTGPDLLNMPLEQLMEVRIVSGGVESGQKSCSLSSPIRPYPGGAVQRRLMGWS
jgi:hypothetical protein